MDSESQAVVESLARALGGNDAKLFTSVMQCLRTKCQKVAGQCTSRRGPCDVSAARAEARATCRHVKLAALAEVEGPCAAYTAKMRKSLVAQSSDAAAVNKQLDDITQGCVRAKGAAHPKCARPPGIDVTCPCLVRTLVSSSRYVQCFDTSLLESLASCASRNCVDQARACAVKNCNFKPPEARPE
ncbi:hypothetical protein M885DRAFT_329054 [Pelagophyceae sp. CCMP2097]|nr:hypothetical protein M885DRAFT_329054 [Pelagophyceae sp. CCMP2097]